MKAAYICNKKHLKAVIGALICLLLTGCNAFIGIPENMEVQPWRTIYLLSLALMLLAFLSSIGLGVVGLLSGAQRGLMIKRWLKLNLYLSMGCWCLLEVSLPANANIRIDLLLIIPAVLLQCGIVLWAHYYFTQHDTKNE